MSGPCVGDTLSVLHDCWPDMQGYDATRHVAPITVQRITHLSDGSIRVTGTRCDGSPIEWTVDREGRDLPAERRAS